MDAPSVLLQQLRSRRSIRRYRQQSVPSALITELLTAATWAPSAHNRQPWRFAVVESDPIKEQLAAAMGARLRNDLEADQLPQAVIAKDVQHSYARITGAPLLVLLALSMEDMDNYADPRRQHNEWIMAVQSTALAGQNLLLAAHALGLGACWLCAPLFCPDTVRDVLDLPLSWEPQALFTVGYPAEERSKSRVPLEQRVRFVDR
jgi:F420 biosynthesis protein FbiB-like protein